MPSLSSRAVFQSTRPVWGATHSPASDPGCARISIHAPRVGRDSGRRLAALRTTTFQSTRPVWGATTRTTGRACRHGQFQSTRPVWGATRADGWRRYVLQHFNPRAPCGARRRGRLAAHAGMANFNPRAPCGARRQVSTQPSQIIRVFQSTRPVWGATSLSFIAARSNGFQSTRPVWGATQPEWRAINHLHISIHAPRVGRDHHATPSAVKIM